ncbi:hypothetical protein EP7_003453 [Isosphaeraceae bacterium EP7]
MTIVRWAYPSAVAATLLLGTTLLPSLAEDPALAAPPVDSVRDALRKPYPWAFGEPTTLKMLALHLKTQLKGRVVLDASALDRLSLAEDESVQIDLPEGVRLQTGLKLLLDQVGLTFKVIPEDNLLLITDAEGAEEPMDRVIGDIKALHRDLHDLQDRIDDIAAALGLDGEGVLLRKPTIIEEKPEGEDPAQPEKKSRPRPGA